MKQIILASNNDNKIKEINNLLKLFNIEAKGLKELKLDSPIENGNDFTENALIKARYTFNKTDLPTIADDSGFCIDSMNGFPGLCSARFAEACGSYSEAFRIINECINPINRKACFITCIAFIYKDENNNIIEKVFEGKIEGEFIYPGRGNNGFGYCPVFLPNGFEQTFAEMSNSLRTKINHRRIALDKFIKYLTQIIN